MRELISRVSAELEQLDDDRLEESSDRLSEVGGAAGVGDEARLGRRLGSRPAAGGCVDRPA